MLRVSLLGNMGAEPELRYSAKGTAIAQVRVAVNQVRTGPDGERQENTEWFRVKVSGPRVDYVQRWSKGSRVLVIGRLDISHYQSREGETRTAFDVWADEIQLLGPRPPVGEPDASVESEPEGASHAAPQATGVSGGRARGGPKANGAASDSDLEDLPF